MDVSCASFTPQVVFIMHDRTACMLPLYSRRQSVSAATRRRRRSLAPRFLRRAGRCGSGGLPLGPELFIPTGLELRSSASHAGLALLFVARLALWAARASAVVGSWPCCRYGVASRAF